ncbi:MFS transporter [Modestobacter sp. I12A-02628]|uniref:MFS transporter n=1 Tax=Goekera deserti TaxID=2497753 RepID=A0A7K3WHR5_9ACTN|nr:MFS transporter [Goekera deserti]MPQ97782.1 MFS transporter [Goekera deserti]NDI48427.1 MFS transporter [Goekera deserti]NEL56028.1 MFS transporter [Goekera deserti]
MSSLRALAANRDFTTLWVGETVSALGSRMSMFVFPLLAYSLSGSAITAALVEGSHLLGLVAALLPAGALADRVDRRRLMIGASAAGMVLYGSLALAGALGRLTVVHLAVVGLLAGVAAGVFGPAQMSAIRSVVTTEQLPAALSQNEAREHVAGLLGGPLGGALYGAVRWLPFAVDTLTYAVSCLMLSRLRTDLSPAPAGTRPRRRLRAEVAEGLRFVVARPLFRVLIATSAAFNLVVNALFFVVLLRMVQAGAHPVEIGLVSTAAGVGGVLGALVAPCLVARVPTGRLTVLIGWSLTLPVVPLIWWATPAAAGAALFTLLLLNPAGNAGIGAYRIAVTPADLQGRVESASQVAGMVAIPLAPLVGGLLLTGLGGGGATAVLAGATAIVALMTTLSRSVRSVPRPAEWVTADTPAHAS